jgi:hypothetical protein
MQLVAVGYVKTIPFLIALAGAAAASQLAAAAAGRYAAYPDARERRPPGPFRTLAGTVLGRRGRPDAERRLRAVGG